MKKFMSFVLTGAIALSSGACCVGNVSDFSMSAKAIPTSGGKPSEDAVVQDKITYDLLKDGTYCVWSTDEALRGDVVIADEINGIPVTGIDSNAFYNNKYITSVVIPDSVTVIGSNAFRQCSALESVTLSKNLEKILSYAFYLCKSLKSIEIPDTVTSIGKAAFQGCYALEKANIPDGVDNITLVFANTAIESIEIPDSITSMDEAFANCSNLKSVNIPSGVTIISSQTFLGCSSLTSITIPENVTQIDSQAFCNCESLTSITIENPDCIIHDSNTTICNTASAGLMSYEKGKYNGTIYAPDDSMAHIYADKYKYNFAVLGEQPPTEETEALKGDANGDNSVTIADAVAILQYLANADEYPLSEQGLKNADVLSDDGVNTEDALQIQKWDAGVIDKL